MADKDFDSALGGLETGPNATPASAGPDVSAGPGDEPGSVSALRAHFPGMPVRHEVMAGDEHVVHVPAERAAEVLRFLKDDPEQHFDYLADLTAVDHGGGRPLEVVYQLWSIPHRRALRVKAALPLDNLEIETVAGLWRTADWLEREVYDMFGIRFAGHPDLRRILMPEHYAEGYPLRKDFPLRGRFSRAEQTRRALAMGVEDLYNTTELQIAGAAPESDASGEDAGDGEGADS